MAFERPRGVRDFLPEEMAERGYVERKLTAAFESYGYRRVQTPTFEFLELFSLKSGDDIREHLYIMEDKGGRKLCLRPEATASVARMYASDMRVRPKPLRLYYTGPMFRYEEPQKGRYREFWQAGVELLGLTGPRADAEVIALVHDSLRSLGLKFTLRVSHIGVLRSLLKRQGFDQAEQDRVIRALDKGDTTFVREHVKDPAFHTLLELKGGVEAVGGAERLAQAEDVKSMLSGLKETLTLLTSAGVGYSVDFSMARGLDYYTGVVFDARVEGLGAQNQVLGGGRYDDLVQLFGGPQTPAVGFAFGMDRLAEAVKQQGGHLPGLRTDAYVIPASDAAADAAFTVAAGLRRARPELVVALELSGRKLNRALQHASETGARYAVIVGEAELKAGSVIIKDMKAATQETVSINDLPNKIL